jgi:hypothetical protein
MKKSAWIMPASLLLSGCVLFHAKDEMHAEERPWCHIFSVNKAELVDEGKNTYFPLWPGYKMKLQHGGDTLIISVLDETKVVDGVRTRVVEERETKDGQVVEVSSNYFAISRLTGDVYYFGEDVDIFKNGKLVGHDGTWRSGVKGAQFGLMMPGRPSVGDRYCQESAPGVAMDRAEVIACNEHCITPEKAFEQCVRVRETSALESGGSDKFYAPGVGLVKDGAFLLTALNCPVCNGEQDVQVYPVKY